MYIRMPSHTGSMKAWGDGWSTSDRLFRQHEAANPDLSWATLNGSIHVVTFLASRTGSGTHCRLCADSDHLAHDCALALVLSSFQPNRYSASQASFRKALPGGTSVTSNHPICNSWNRGKCACAPICTYRPMCHMPGGPSPGEGLPPHSGRQHFSPTSSTTLTRQKGDQMS